MAAKGTKEVDEKRTIIIIPEDGDTASISTFNRKWTNRLVKLEEEGVAEEVATSIEGAREFELPKKLIRIPFNRQPREWTEEQKEEARERLAGVREAVKASKTAAAKKAGKATAVKGKAGTTTAVATKAVAAAPAKGKAKATPPPAPVKKGKKAAPIIEDEEDFEDEEGMEDEIEEPEDEELEEVVVKAPAKKNGAKKAR